MTQTQRLAVLPNSSGREVVVRPASRCQSRASDGDDIVHNSALHNVAMAYSGHGHAAMMSNLIAGTSGSSSGVPPQAPHRR